MKTQKGFTLIELLVAVGLSALVASIGAFSIFQMKKMERTIYLKTEGITTKAFAETFLAKVLKQAGPSLNLITTEDDDGQAFFDHIPTAPSRLFTPEQADRNLTLRLGQRTEVQILGFRGEASKIMYMDPAQAYAINYVDEWTTPTFNYSGVNAGGLAGSFFGADWAADRLYLLWSPQSHFQATNGVVDLARPAPSLSFLGRVNSGGSDLGTSGFNFVRSADPRAPTITINSPDRLFRRIPLVGGSAPLVLLREVEMHRVWLEPDPSIPGAARVMHSSNVSPNPFLLADKVRTVKFYRPNATRSIFGVEVCMASQGEQCD